MERQRRNFGAPCQFSDCNAGDQKQKNVVECTAYQDQSSSIKKMEQNTGTQVAEISYQYLLCGILLCSVTDIKHTTVPLLEQAHIEDCSWIINEFTLSINFEHNAEVVAI